MAKVNRHNHPLMVKARRASYYAGKRDGFNDGFKKGFEQRCENLQHYYQTILAVFQKRIDLANEIIRKCKEDNNG